MKAPAENLHLVIGAGPAGITAAYALTQRGVPVIVAEQDRQVGGLARTVEYRGFLFDLGGHRFFTKSRFLQVIGRNGMHRYNNMDHSMLTALLAVRNIFGEKHDLWAVNEDEEYHEMPEK